MGKLQQGDFGIAPLYLMRGRKAQEQSVILYVFEAEVSGRKWNLSSLGADAGATPSTIKKLCEGLVDAGVMEVRDDKRGGPYALMLDCVPDGTPRNTPQKAPGSPSEDQRLPGWVFVAVNRYREIQGVISPKVMHNALRAAVQFYGSSAVIDGLERYARESDPRFNPSPFKFAAQVTKWVTQQGPVAHGRDMREMV